MLVFRLYVLNAIDMFLITLKVLNDFTFPQTIKKVFETKKQCYEFLNEFPCNLVVDWSISPLLVQDVLDSKSLSKCKKMCTICIEYDDNSKKIYHNVHTNNVGSLFFDGHNHLNVKKFIIHVD